MARIEHMLALKKERLTPLRHICPVSFYRNNASLFFQSLICYVDQPTKRILVERPYVNSGLLSNRY